MTIRVLLVDDHELMREGLRAIIDNDPGMEVVGEAADGRAALARAKEMRPDVVLMDLAMAELNGIDATRRVLAAVPDAKVVALSTHGARTWVLAALDAGASGYVLKASAYDELQRAVREVHTGRTYLCPEVAGAVVAAAGRPRPGQSSFDVLAPREREVLQLVGEGLSSSAIAQRLHLSPHTVETHRRNLMHKLDLHNVADVTRYAISEGLVQADQPYPKEPYPKEPYPKEPYPKE